MPPNGKSVSLLLLLLWMLYLGYSQASICCDDYTLSNDDRPRVCSNGRNINLNCTNTYTLDPTLRPTEKYMVEPNTKDLLGYYFIVANSTKYCLGAYLTEDGGSSREVAVVCSDAFQILTDDDLKLLYYTKPIQIMSCVCFLLTAIVYQVIDQLKDIQGVCIFHFSVLMSANYLFMAIPPDFSSLLPSHLCITHSYLMCFCLVSGFLWMHILAYNMWKTSKGCIFDKEQEIQKYKIICYTAPLIMILIPLASLYINGAFFDEDISCSVHQRWLLGIYVGLPVLGSMLINAFYFIDTSRRLWQFYKEQTQPSAIKGLRYRFGLYVKLFLITGLPWLLFFVASSFESGLTTTYILLSLMAYSQGIFVFVIMVLCRKRARRGLAAQKIMGRQIFPQKWANINDNEETEEEYQFEASTPRQENQNHL